VCVCVSGPLKAEKTHRKTPISRLSIGTPVILGLSFLDWRPIALRGARR